MLTQLQALLSLQEDDVVIHGYEAQLAALEPRMRELDARCERLNQAIGRAEAGVVAEEEKQAFLRDKIAEHRLLIEHNQTAMDAVKTLKQATAAAAQMEQAKRIVSSEESDLLAVNRRLEELRAALAGQRAELATIEAEQEVARNEVAEQRGTIDVDLAKARQSRAAKADVVPAELRSRYDRIRGRKRVEAVFAMRGMSCGNCDTAIPMQRRHTMSTTAAIELCEGCGVLMYFTPA
ncbi:MAG: hypothetical protein O2973_08015 [Gemmatimonadetes bacterium]|nr:hypothetical protein [Gemmatimonadota bacterium]